MLARAEAPRTAALPSIAPGGAEKALSLTSTEAQKAIATSLAYFTGQARSLAFGGAQLVAHNVERDELGMTHVRLD